MRIETIGDAYTFGSIGHIRAKELPGDLWELELYPPSGGFRPPDETAMQIDICGVPSAEVHRLATVAPHLFVGEAERLLAKTRHKAEENAA